MSKSLTLCHSNSPVSDSLVATVPEKKSGNIAMSLKQLLELKPQRESETVAASLELSVCLKVVLGARV